MSRVETTLEVEAPVGDCFAMWRCMDCVTGFLRHVEVTGCEDNQIYWHWKVNSPWGEPIEWDTVIDSMEENQFLSWHSDEFAVADTSGSVQFDSLNDNRTRLHVEMMFGPPVNEGEEIDELFDKVIESQVLEDLETFRRIMNSEHPDSNGHALSHRLVPETVGTEQNASGTPPVSTS